MRNQMGYPLLLSTYKSLEETNLNLSRASNFNKESCASADLDGQVVESTQKDGHIARSCAHL